MCKETNSNHLHAESKTLPVKEHCQMLSKQFLLATQQDSHPNNNTDINHNSDRLMKNTLTSQHGDYIRPLIQPGNLNYKSLIKTIHTESVSTYIQSQDNNPVLDELPPAKKQIRINTTQKNYNSTITAKVRPQFHPQQLPI